MSKFIEATLEDDGTKAFINLNLVSWIKIEDNKYILNLLGKRYNVPIHCKEVRELVIVKD